MTIIRNAKFRILPPQPVRSGLHRPVCLGVSKPRSMILPFGHGLMAERGRLAGMNGIFDLSLVKNISLGKRFEFFDHEIMKLALIAIGLLATTGVVYAACVFC
jgi:hypothetical protein